MSQSGRLVGSTPVPGAGIQTITGNNGAIHVGPDGGGDVIIQGAGDITVTGDALTHTLTITSAGVAGTYVTDAGNAIPLAGVLNVIGTADEVNTIGFGNTIQIGLPANVQITANLDVGSTLTVWHDLNVVDDITSTLGSIYAPFGDIVSGNGLVGRDLVVTNGVDITGPSVYQSLNRGVVQVDAVHTLFTSEGADGQVLIGSSTGASIWSTLTAGAGIAITNAANSITIEATGALASTYRTDAGDAQPLLGIINIVGGANINTVGAANTVTINLDNDIALNSVTANTLVANTSITSPIANITDNLSVTNTITATTITAAGTVQGSTLHSTQDITAARDIVATRYITGNEVSGITVNAVATLNSLGNLVVSTHNGVLQANAAGLVSATNGNPTGTNGQVLISGPGAPAWGALESADGSVAITYPGNNRINLRAVSGVAPATISSFFARPAAAITRAFGANVKYYFGAEAAYTIAGTDCFNTGGNFYLGNGAGTPCNYTAPSTGLYYFEVRFEPRDGAYNIIYLRTYVGIENITRGISYNTWVVGHDVGIPWWQGMVQLAAGNIVRFFFCPTQTLVGCTVSGGYICGYKIA